jgi:hypothetical protein
MITGYMQPVFKIGCRFHYGGRFGFFVCGVFHTCFGMAQDIPRLTYCI